MPIDLPNLIAKAQMDPGWWSGLGVGAPMVGGGIFPGTPQAQELDYLDAGPPGTAMVAGAGVPLGLMMASMTKPNIYFSRGGDAIGPEYHGYIAAVDNDSNKVIGQVTYSYWNKKPQIKMIEILPEYQRKGVASTLLDELQKDFPKKRIGIQGDYMTEAGEGLWNKWRKTK